MSGRVRISLDLNNDKRNSEPSLTSTSLTPDETEKFLKRKKRRSITFEEIKPRTLVSSEKKKEETLEDEAKTTTSPMNRLTRAKRSLSIEALTSQIFKPQTDSPSSPTSSSPRSRDSATPPGSTTRKRRSSKRLSKGFNKEFGILTKDDSISKLECILHKEPETSTFRWTSERFTYPPWEKPDAESTTKPLIDRVCLNSDFNIEVPLSENTPADLSIFELERNTYFFKQLLNISDNVKHYYRKNSEMPVIMTISRDKNEQTSKVLIRTPQSDIRVLISKSTTAKMIKTLCKEFPDLLEEFEIFPIKTDIPRWNKELLSFEAKQISFQEKIGVFCVKPGQTTEDEFLSNETPSPEFKKFINFLGEEIELEGWQKFRGGLDTKENTTGHRSVYTTYKGFEIMFHISTMLPYNPNDPQQVCKKRHIGNDVVVIIFKENNTPFDPLCIRSHFNHVFFVIQPAMIAGKTHYAVEVATKPGVVPFAPYLTKPALYPMSEEFRAVLLAKLLNANRAAMYAPNFLQKYERTRKMMLNDYLKSVPIK